VSSDAQMVVLRKLGTVLAGATPDFSKEPRTPLDGFGFLFRASPALAARAPRHPYPLAYAPDAAVLAKRTEISLFVGSQASLWASHSGR